MQQKVPPPAIPPPQSSEPICESQRRARALTRREQPCPQCGYPMSDLKGSREAICQNCGFKDSCCY